MRVLDAMMEYLENSATELASLLQQRDYENALGLMDERVNHISQMVAMIKQHSPPQTDIDSIYMVLSQQELSLKKIATEHHQEIALKLARLGKVSKAEHVYRVNSKEF